MKTFNLQVHPDRWADPKSRSPEEFYDLHHRLLFRVQNLKYFLDPPEGMAVFKSVLS